MALRAKPSKPKRLGETRTRGGCPLLWDGLWDCIRASRHAMPPGARAAGRWPEQPGWLGPGWPGPHWPGPGLARPRLTRPRLARPVYPWPSRPKLVRSELIRPRDTPGGPAEPRTRSFSTGQHWTLGALRPRRVASACGGKRAQLLQRRRSRKRGMARRREGGRSEGGAIAEVSGRDLYRQRNRRSRIFLEKGWSGACKG